MKHLICDRRLFAAIVGMCLLTVLGYFKGADVSSAIATVCLAVAAANASEKIFKKDQTK